MSSSATADVDESSTKVSILWRVRAAESSKAVFSSVSHPPLLFWMVSLAYSNSDL